MPLPLLREGPARALGPGSHVSRVFFLADHAAKPCSVACALSEEVEALSLGGAFYRVFHSSELEMCLLPPWKETEAQAGEEPASPGVQEAAGQGLWLRPPGGQVAEPSSLRVLDRALPGFPVLPDPSDPERNDNKNSLYFKAF